ncbi:MAG: hypothetical protein Q8K60_04525, partial [Parachlamydiaceae bacterium]|nr:hypothetical protein [Parachlamydiaceae bacterium]
MIPINNLVDNPLLSINSSLTLNKIENNSSENFQNEQNHNNTQLDGLHPFFPCFSNPDIIFKIINELGFCNNYGVFNGSCSRLFVFEILKKSPSFFNLQSRINDLLDKKFSISTGPIVYLKKHYPLNIQISLREILEYIDGIFPLKATDPKNIKHVYLLECYLIGSELAHLIGKDCFIEMCHRLFNEKIDLKTLETWFSTMEHFSEQIDKEGADIDLRIVLSCNNIDSYAYVTQSILEKLTIKIMSYIYENYSKEPIYNPSLDLFNICKSFLLASNGIRHFNRIDKGLTKCTILSLNTDYKPIDINVVGFYNQQLTLENPNLSSLNCYGLSLMGFLSTHSLEKILINSDPFYGQALVDLLLNSMTPTTFNEDGWKHAIRKGGRFLHPSHEKKMVNYLLENRDQILSKLDPKRIILPEEKRNTLEGYIYLVIQAYFKKVENEISNIDLEPYYLGGFIFRACQSLANDINFNNEFFFQLWELVENYHWKVTIKEQCSSSSMFTQMKIALIDDRVPWDVFVAYLEILIWLWDSESATIHNGKPYFYLKKPFHMWLKIQLNDSVEKVENYFSKHKFSNSLMKIGEIFFVEKNTIQSKHPLNDYLSTLEIDPFIFNEKIEKLLNSPSNIIQTIGLQLYLLLFESFPSDLLYLTIYRHQSQLISGVINQHQEKMVHEKLKDFHESIDPFKLIVKALKKQSIEKLNQEKLKLLPLLISYTSSDIEHVQEVMNIIIQLVQDVLSFTPGSEDIDDGSVWEWFDQFFLSSIFINFSQKVYQSSVENNIKLKKTFLEYLRKSYLINTTNREKSLWEIFQQTLKLFPKTRNEDTQALNLEISVLLAMLLKEASFIPDRIFKWLLEFQTTILERLYKNNHIDQLKILLKTLHEINPSKNQHENYKREIFKLDWESMTINQDILLLLNKNDLDFLKEYIKSHQYSKLIDLLVLMIENKKENELIKDLFNWVCELNKDQAIFHLFYGTQFIQRLDQPVPFDQTRFNDLVLLYCKSLWEKTFYVEFIATLQLLSYKDFSYQGKLNSFSSESWKILWTFLLEQQEIDIVVKNDSVLSCWNIYRISKYGAFEFNNREVFSIAVHCLKNASYLE